MNSWVSNQLVVVLTENDREDDDDGDDEGENVVK